MNTPSHVVYALVLLGRPARPELLAPIAIGSLVPDAPMFVFYGVERWLHGRPPSWLWSVGYFEPGWQSFFDLFNSLPLIGVGALVALGLRSQRALMFFAAMAFHCLCDLLVHHDDAHRHFYPLSDWRFESPISYWDALHYGAWMGGLEIVLGAAACALLWRSHSLRWVRGASALLLGLYTLAAAAGTWFLLRPAPV